MRLEREKVGEEAGRKMSTTNRPPPRRRSNRLPALSMPGEKAQRSILHAFTFEKLCDSHALWMFHIQT